jgi:hypothetical protein
MKISEPIFIKKAGKRGYEITADLAGHGKIKRFGRTEEEAKERFFETCGAAGKRAAPSRSRAGEAQRQR